MTEAIIALFVGAAIFITGMNMMSSGLKKSTGKGLKRLFRKIQNNRFAGFGIGAAVTALIQSSAATSVMAIGFINAGAMSIFQGICVILGAYLGTTVTGLIVSLSTFSFSSYLVLLAVLGTILIFFTNEKVKSIGEIIAGLGILFFGLESMSNAFKNSVEMTELCQNIFSSISFPLLLLLIGAFFTALVQSSSATSGIVIVMVAGGSISLSSGLYLVLGATIGTVITTILATIGGSINAKRTGLVCLILRTITASIATILVWIFADAIENALRTIFPSEGLAVAMFLVVYNAIFMVALLPFAEKFEKLGLKLLKDKTEERLADAIQYIDTKLTNMPSIAMMQAKKEIIHMMSLSQANFKFGYERMINQLSINDADIKLNEDKIDYINNKLTSFLILLSHNVSMEDEKKVGSYFHVINDIERIGDHGYNFYELSLKMADNELMFSETAKAELNEMYSVVDQMFQIAFEIFQNKSFNKLNDLHLLEDKTDKLKTQLNANHYERITKNKCTIGLSPFYSNLVSELERIGDHLVNVAYSIINPTGDTEEELNLTKE